MTVTPTFLGVLTDNVGNGNLICEISMSVGTKSRLNIAQNSIKAIKVGNQLEGVVLQSILHHRS